eukprot:898500-Pleurochrysis_carterae.AAC.1
MRVQRKQVVDVASQGDAMLSFVDYPSHCENARVLAALLHANVMGCCGSLRCCVASSAGGDASMIGAGGRADVEGGSGIAGSVGGVLSLSGSRSSGRDTVSSVCRCDAMTRAKRKFRSGG